MAEIEIVQADRDAAADLVERLDRFATGLIRASEIRRGIGDVDNEPEVQAFARHCRAPTGDEYGRGIDDAAKVADDCIAQTGLDIGEVRQALSAEELSARGFIASTARKIAEQIRALKGSPA